MLVEMCHRGGDTVKGGMGTEHEAVFGVVGSQPGPRLALSNGLVSVGEQGALVRGVECVKGRSRHGGIHEPVGRDWNSFWTESEEEGEGVRDPENCNRRLGQSDRNENREEQRHPEPHPLVLA